MKQGSVIVAHRGGAGMSLENTETALRRALAANVSMIEIDARLTYDKKLILCHDSDLERVAGDKTKVSEHTWTTIQDIPLSDGSKILTLENALRIIGSTPVMIELKDAGSEYSLLAALDKFPKAQVSVISFKIPQLAMLKEMRPKLALYALEHTKPMDVVQIARALKLTGIGMNFWILNPLVYWMARRAKLDVYVYTVNNVFYAWFLRLLYPQIKISTDYPNHLLPRTKSSRSKKT